MLQDVKFTLQLDLFEYCTDELQKKLMPAREAMKAEEDRQLEAVNQVCCCHSLHLSPLSPSLFLSLHLSFPFSPSPYLFSLPLSLYIQFLYLCSLSPPPFPVLSFASPLHPFLCSPLPYLFTSCLASLPSHLCPVSLCIHPSPC